MAHEPLLAQARLEWRRQGGRKSSKKAVLAEAAQVETPEQVRDILARTLDAVRTGAMDAQTANAICRTCSLLLKAIRETDLARRLQELESLVRPTKG